MSVTKKNFSLFHGQSAQELCEQMNDYIEKTNGEVYLRTIEIKETSNGLLATVTAEHYDMTLENDLTLHVFEGASTEEVNEQIEKSSLDLESLDFFILNERYVWFFSETN